VIADAVRAVWADPLTRTLGLHDRLAAIEARLNEPPPEPPPSDRTALILYLFEVRRLTMKAIATRLGISHRRVSQIRQAALGELG